MFRFILAISLFSSSACGGGGVEAVGIGSLRVSFVGEPVAAKVMQPFSTELVEVKVRIEAFKADGKSRDGAFNRPVMLQLLPAGELADQPLSVPVKNGVADNIVVRFRNAFGTVRLAAVDEGFAARLTDLAKAACNNGRDDDGDGYIDTPDDRGCTAPNDDNEAGGSGTAGMSPPLYFANPTISDVQRPVAIGESKDASPLTGQRVAIDGGWMFVTRVSVDGFYVTDFAGAKWTGSAFDFSAQDHAYRSVFAYNFSAPTNLREGDCLVQLSGGVEEFYGYTELGKPTWKKGDHAFCDGLAIQAGVKSCQGASCRLAWEKLAATPVDLTKLTVQDNGSELSVWDQRTFQTERFESALVQVTDVHVMDELRTCDKSGNATIDFSNRAEADCAEKCGKEPRCQVRETFDRYQQWSVYFTDGAGEERELAVVSAGSISKFAPEKSLGRPIGKLVGTLRHLSFGNPPWILEPRRPADCVGCTATTAQ